ncbi:multisubunit potassium/proton antiporter PhaG subunit [Tamilnaduibacter salinus]|uniref:Multisubunit potassium/proton antiporter PhaG subunit n=1 Tax=Tamilnaduibacter salinus TaxID=1484056 RepID=A0A2A2I3S8_9GAMM|nr:Na+/H+ antiporter subunit G [Tamilnaduibacter salinus]PAV25785.1 Na+/H+ antiporter subunit G [Tamilnaduibacter salinus]PVY75766.1 multisubunit potassium/proton antiporter PhaG subunit [Tamilnaduibacter salinus]
MTLAIELGISILLIIGGVFALIGAIGLARLPDFYTRLHGPTKATTIGVGSIALASFAYFAGANASYDLIELLIMVFLFMTAPISANFLAKAAMHLKVKTTDNTRGQPWDQ